MEQADPGSSPIRKRPKRASKPCDACRRRKSRCVVKDDNATCSMCELRVSACTFTGAVREQRRTRSPVEPAHESHIIRQTATFADPDSWPVARGESAADEIANEDGNLGCLEARSLGSEEHRFAELYGLTSDAEPLLMRHRPYDAARHEYSLETHSMRRVQTKDNGVDYPLAFHMVEDHKAIGYTGEYTEADAIEAIVQPFGPRLIRLYWLLVHPSFPLLSRQRFTQQYERSHRNINSALLGAVYLQALAWWSYDSELALRPQPNTVKLRKQTLDAMQNAFHRPRLSSIQAMLIYLHCRPDEPLTADHTYARGLTSQMLAVSEAMGLHLNATDWAIPAWEKAERKRLSWAVYMQDKWTALTYGRPSHITDGNWDVEDLGAYDFGVSVESGIESNRHTDDSTGLTQYMLMVDLTKILSRVLATFFTIQASKEQDTARLFDLAQPFLQELSILRQQLLVSLPITAQRTRHLSSVASAHLCYWGVTINIYRRLVRSAALKPLCFDPSLLSSIRQQATQTAHEATSFVTTLRLDQLESFWYFPSPYLFALVGSFQTLLLVTSLSRSERDYWREALNSLLWSLRIMSKASDPMRYAVNRLEGGVLRGLDHVVAVNLNTPLHSPNPEPLDLEQLLRQLDSAQYVQTASAFTDLGSLSFDWLDDLHDAHQQAR